MADATQAFNSPRRGPSLHSVSVYAADGYSLVQGTMVALNADGYAVSAGSVGAITVAGVYAPKSGDVLTQGVLVGDGSQSDTNRANLECGLFDFDNYATHPVLLANVGASCYAKDNHTVSINSGDGPLVGKVMFVNGDGSITVGVGLPSVSLD